jgi:hypothetical protein
MRDLEEGRNAEGFGELGAQAREAQVVEKNIALNLPCDALNPNASLRSRNIAYTPDSCDGMGI